MRLRWDGQASVDLKTRLDAYADSGVGHVVVELDCNERHWDAALDALARMAER